MNNNDDNINDDSYNEPVEFTFFIKNGKSFKLLIDTIKTINSTGNFIFSQSGLKYTEYNTEYKILVQFEIFGDKLLYADKSPGYTYTSDIPEYIIRLDIKSVKDNLSQIDIKDAILIYKNKNENMIYFRKIQDNTDDSSVAICCMVVPKIRDIETIYGPDYNRSEDNPNINITSVKLKSDLKPIIKSKSEKVKLIATHNTIRFEGTNVDRSLYAIAHFKSQSNSINIPGLDFLGLGIPEPSNIETEIDYKLIKLLYKLESFCADKKVGIFIQNDNPIKVVSKIGNIKDGNSYGVLKLYILSN